jgi:hypothetical protein
MKIKKIENCYQCSSIHHFPVGRPACFAIAGTPLIDDQGTILPDCPLEDYPDIKMPTREECEIYFNNKIDGVEKEHPQIWAYLNGAMEMYDYLIERMKK